MVNLKTLQSNQFLKPPCPIHTIKIYLKQKSAELQSTGALSVHIDRIGLWCNSIFVE